MYRVARATCFPNSGKIALVIGEPSENEYGAFVWWPCLVDESITRVFVLDLESLEEEND